MNAEIGWPGYQRTRDGEGGDARRGGRVGRSQSRSGNSLQCYLSWGFAGVYFSYPFNKK